MIASNKSINSSLDEDEMTQFLNSYKSEISFIFSSGRAATDDNRQFWGRALARSMFSSIEGILFLMKQKVITVAQDLGVQFNHVEIEFLNEVETKLNDNSDVRTSKAKISSTNNLTGTFKFFSKAACSTFKLDRGDEGWMAFTEASTIRDRITHPKCVADMHFTMDDLHALQKAHAWFSKSVSDCLGAAMKGIEKERKRQASNKNNPGS